MIYVVSGFPRSGTSLAMQCLVAAGVPAYWSPVRERIMDRKNERDYAPNPNGWYEVSPTQYMTRGFTAEVTEGCCVKVPTLGLLALATRPTVVIWMHRDPEEIKQSYDRTFPDKPITEKWPEYLEELNKATRDILEDRQSISIYDIQYTDLLDNPYLLVDKFNLKIRRTAVDLNLYRNKVK
jgi:hypothetical protein